jgi:cystathionine beta-synthase
VQIAASLLELVGQTPLVYLDRVRHKKGARVAAKLESFNPGSSVKDRIGLPLIRAGEAQGLLKPGGTIVEPTSGNTGLGLAMAAALLDYRMICTLPDKVTIEKRRLLQAVGAQLVICPTNVDPEDPRSYYKQAERIRDEDGAYLPYQYRNQANPEAHYQSTGPEIWRQTDGRITHFVCGVGTGGTISGTGRYLHEKKSNVQVIGVDTVGSVYTYYFQHGRMPPAEQIHQYLIDGIGEDIMPETVWWDDIDGMVPVSDEDAYLMMARLAREEAILSGSSAGAAVHAAVELASKLPADALVVTLLPDTGERYLSKFNEEWLAKQGLTKALAYLKGRPAVGKGTTESAQSPRSKATATKATSTPTKKPASKSTSAKKTSRKVRS